MKLILQKNVFIFSIFRQILKWKISYNMEYIYCQEQIGQSCIYDCNSIPYYFLQTNNTITKLKLVVLF